MAKRQKNWARKERQRLLLKYGNKCNWPKCRKRKDLHFDCIEPMGDSHHKGSTDQRMCFYRKMDKIGNLQLLCEYHNGVKSLKERETHPF